ncbi:MAG: ABC transporter ATP-binding protein [Chloroflexi bacterium]|nr:ABC transporter ATP-binding protein [Chloroflexota bacterium]
MLEIDQITKDYDRQPLLRGVSFSVRRGETLCLLGASGSGKSTLLRIIAGLEDAKSGEIRWDGEDISRIPVHERQFGLMFQDYALFPHRSVAQNVAFGLKMQKISEEETAQRVSEALAQVNMQSFANRRVTDLSGGEQQRVALARALAPRPRLLMLDEPLGALDRTLRERLVGELRELLHQTQIPAIYVTHDQEEAFTLGDRLVLISEGMVAQAGTPEEIYARPASGWVARFLGLNNILSGVVEAANPLVVQTELGRLVSSAPDCGEPRVGGAVEVLIKPTARVAVEGEQGANCVEGEVLDSVFRGEFQSILLRCQPGLVFQFHVRQSLRVGERVTLCLPEDGVICLQG